MGIKSEDCTVVVEQGEAAVVARGGSSALETMVLLAAGVSQLWYWNAILNLSEVINDEYFPAYADSLASYMTFVFEAAALLSFLLCRSLDGLSPRVMWWSAVANVLLSILTPLVLLVRVEQVRVALWYLCTAGFGFWMALSQVSHYGLAANLPGGVRTVVVSAGQGAAGPLSFCLYLLMIRLWRLAPIRAISVQMALHFLVTLLGPFGLWALRRRPDIQRHVARQREALAAVVAERGKPTLLQLLRKGWFPLLNVALTFFCSYLVYPNIGPFKWSGSGGESQREVVIGCAQLGQILGRSAPLLSLFVLKLRTVFAVNLLRCAYPVLFTLAAVYTSVSAFRAYWLQCLLLLTLALSEGWMASLGLLHSALAGENILEKSELSMLAVATLTVGMTLALGLTSPLQSAVHI